jgi:hypothetical protein
LLSPARYRHPGDVIRLIIAGLVFAGALVVTIAAHATYAGAGAAAVTAVAPATAAGRVLAGLVQVCFGAAAVAAVVVTLRYRRFRLLVSLASGAVLTGRRADRRHSSRGRGASARSGGRGRPMAVAFRRVAGGPCGSCRRRGRHGHSRAVAPAGHLLAARRAGLAVPAHPAAPGVRVNPPTMIRVACAGLVLAVALSACTSSGGRVSSAAGKPAGRPGTVISVGSFDFPESVLLADIYGNALAANGVALLFTTDPSIPARHLVVLADDRGLQPAESITPLLRKDVIARYGPNLVTVLTRVSALLDTGTLRALDARVELGGQDPGLVARGWLRAHGLIPAGGGVR